ncbi:MAG: DegT/DnrJ/EryC1/StrS family aminotransferase [Planctomycetes bacterium]|nr:DegT/DnrJ/EryC1/StrS family aminotransferase [Planctomycetota bacterium]
MKVQQFSPSVGQQEVFNLLDTLRDNWMTEGKWTARLEAMIRDRCGCSYALMVPNGTLALFAALKVLGIGPGDEVLVPDFTFFGSASAVALTGAKPVLVDVRASDFTMDPGAAERSIGPATRCIMPVHIYGQTCDMAALTKLAQGHDLLMVEDAAQGMGVTCGDRHVGTFGDIGCMSFFADKTITTGEGGVLLVNDQELAERCMYFKNQGRLERGSFVHPQMGYNFRITDMQAAIGVAQFERIDAVIARKREIVDLYREHLAAAPGIEWPADNGLGQTVPFRANILVDHAERLADFLSTKDIQARRFFYPLHRQPSLNADNAVVRETPKQSVRLFERGLSLPSSPDITTEEIRYVCSSITDFLGTAARPDRLTDRSALQCEPTPVS